MTENSFESGIQGGEQEANAKEYWGPEMWEMIEAQHEEPGATPKSQENSVHTLEVPKDPEALHEWIVNELGDTELAERINKHPELTRQFIEGDGLPAPEFFEMVRAIASKDKALLRELLNTAINHDRLLPLSYDRVVGNLSEEYSNDYFLQERFEATENAASSYASEREKTKEELAAIDYADKAINSIRGRYGLPVSEILPEQLHILRAESLSNGEHGKADLHKQEIRLSDEHGTNMYSKIIHELTHLHGYAAMQIYEEGGVHHIGTYRIGLNVNSRRLSETQEPKVYLNRINEAVTEEMANRIFQGIPNDEPDLGPALTKHRRLLAEIVEKNPEQFNAMHRPYWISGLQEEGSGVRFKYAYVPERQMLFALFDKIAERNVLFEEKSKEEAEEELFEMLQKAMFTGNILPFGRLFNETFGNGKFREFGHLQTTEEQQAFIEGL